MHELKRKDGKVRINDKNNICRFFSFWIRDVSRSLEMVRFYVEFVKILVKWRCKTDK